MTDNIIILVLLGAGLGLIWAVTDSVENSSRKRKESMDDITELIECDLCGNLSVIVRGKKQSQVICPHCEHVTIPI